MKSAAWIRALAVMALLASACGPASGPATGKALATRSGSPYPTPTLTSHVCSLPSIPCLALVTLRGSNSVVVRDVTDISRPKTVSTMPELSMLQFATANEASGIDYGVRNTGLVRMPFGGSPRTVLPDSGRLPGYYDWSPDGSALVYLTHSPTESNSVMALHQLTSSGDRVLDGSIPALPAVGCESEFCPLAEAWDARLAYSTDGATISWVTSIANVNTFRLWASGGKLLVSSGSPVRSMSVWSGNFLYFRDAKGVQAWRDGITAPFLPGVAWIRPKASPGGGQIVYETRDAHHVAHTFVLDTTTRKIRELKRARFDPHFLTPRYVWYQGQRACVAGDHCPTGWSAIASGKTYIYDLLAASESESRITAIYDVWPHAA